MEFEANPFIDIRNGISNCKNLCQKQKKHGKYYFAVVSLYLQLFNGAILRGTNYKNKKNFYQHNVIINFKKYCVLKNAVNVFCFHKINNYSKLIYKAPLNNYKV